jgi:hypothetical protein
MYENVEIECRGLIHQAHILIRQIISAGLINQTLHKMNYILTIEKKT